MYNLCVKVCVPDLPSMASSGFNEAQSNRTMASALQLGSTTEAEAASRARGPPSRNISASTSSPQLSATPADLPAPVASMDPRTELRCSVRSSHTAAGLLGGTSHAATGLLGGPTATGLLGGGAAVPREQYSRAARSYANAHMRHAIHLSHNRENAFVLDGVRTARNQEPRRTGAQRRGSAKASQYPTAHHVPSRAAPPSWSTPAPSRPRRPSAS